MNRTTAESAAALVTHVSGGRLIATVRHLGIRAPGDDWIVDVERGTGAHIPFLSAEDLVNWLAGYVTPR